ncbi:MAG: ABC transporter ATP-binding protein [bacterium]|jgi:putative ABC transport system ATP-binding protein
MNEKAKEKIPKIILKNVSKYYKTEGEKLVALSNVNLVIEEGEFVGIMGPSGAGKSTLLLIISTIEKPSFGEIYIDSLSINQMFDSDLQLIRLNKIGMVFQDYYLISSLSALENVLLPIEISNKFSNPIKRAQELLKMVGIKENRFNDNVNKFSGGEKQRIAIARALANDPDIIIADEPTANLDTKNSKIIMDIFTNINKQLNKTIIIATHDPKVLAFTEKVYFINDGKLTT